MTQKLKILIAGIFLIVTIASLVTFWLKSKEDTFADEIISDASSSFKNSLENFLSSVELSINEVKLKNNNTDFSNPDNKKLDAYFTELILSESYLKGVALSGKNFSYIIFRDNSSWATTFDTVLNDSLAGWKRLNNNLDVLSEWTDVYRVFPNDQNIEHITNSLKSSEYVWRASEKQIQELNNFVSIIFKSLNNTGDSVVVGLIYSAHEISRNFASVLRFENPLVSILGTDNSIVTPIITNDTTSINTYKLLSVDIDKLINTWKNSETKNPHSYSFEKFNKNYWTRIVNLTPAVGVDGFAVTISASDLAETERKQEMVYIYLSAFFGLLTLVFLYLLFFKRKGINSTTYNSEIPILEDNEILTLIKEGETEFVEFKSSLRWDYHEEKVNKILENVILKSIAAFANAKGGTLFIGVSDDMNILGLENDFNTLRKKNADYFELHLRKLINNQYGIAFANEFLSMSFHEFDGKTVCSIQILSSDHPVFLKTKNKQGNEVEKFYVRSGNASPEISSLKEVNEYIKARF